jgi:hypothetical protein
MVVVLNGEPGWICLMCCNSDSKSLLSPLYPFLIFLVLFSVIVLHWITQKDKATTMSTPKKAYSKQNPATSQAKRATSRLPTCDIEGYELGLKDQRKGQGVTTLVTAAKDDEDAFERITVPPNAITVESSHVREVFEIKSDRRSQSRGSESDDFHQIQSGSTDDFFRKY